MHSVDRTTAIDGAESQRSTLPMVTPCRRRKQIRRPRSQFRRRPEKKAPPDPFGPAEPIVRLSAVERFLSPVCDDEPLPVPPAKPFDLDAVCETLASLPKRAPRERLLRQAGSAAADGSVHPGEAFRAAVAGGVAVLANGAGDG